VGTLNGSELSPSVGAVAPVTDALDGDEGVSARPVISVPVWPTVADAAKPGVLDVGLAGTWACATSMAASHVIITRMNIRSMGPPHPAGR
jgi:hypothetical protein